MSALDLATIPSGINTHERLAVWAIQCLQSSTGNLQVVVRQNEPMVPAVQCALGVTGDNVPRLILSGYIPVDRDALNDPNHKTWMAAKDLSTAPPHANLLSN